MNYRPCFLTVLLNELASQLSVSAQRDLTYIESRLKHEGVSFLTITLPSFCDGLDRSIEEGQATPLHFPAFGRRSKGCLPRFLSGFTSLVFHDNGLLKDDANEFAIYCIRQISRFFKKAKIPCSNARNVAAEENYVKTDKELYYAQESIEKKHDPNLDNVSAIVVSDLFSDIHRLSLLPSHGPGATAERYTRNGRIRIKQWPIRSEPWFPLCQNAIPNIGWTICTEELAKYVSSSDEPPVRVVFVPKTLTTPRVIAIEPSHIQYMQQGLMRYMVKKIESHPLTSKSVHFKDQSLNRESARKSSLDRKYATIDLSEASDRVSLSLVKRIFKDSSMLGFLLACRSERALLPSGKLVDLNKFASMGSATCFPVEAFVFYILIQSAIHDFVGIRLSRQSISTISKYIHVYGDDIIVPVAWLECVTNKLTDYGLKVNVHKSFAKSHFRESCGGDYYKGHSVKPVYHRVNPEHIGNRLVESDLVSLCQMSNQLYAEGLWTTAQAVRDVVERQVGKLPRRSYDSSGLTFLSFRYNTYNRWHKHYQRPASFTKTIRPIRTDDNVSKDLLSCVTATLRNIGNETSVDLESSVKSHSFRLKNGWVF